MVKRFVQCAACVFVLMVAFTPLLECFDHWDGPTTPMTDTELRVTAWLAVAGTIAVVMRVAHSAALVKADCKGSQLRVIAVRAFLWCACCAAVPTASPPLIPLRI